MNVYNLDELECFRQKIRKIRIIKKILLGIPIGLFLTFWFMGFIGKGVSTAFLGVFWIVPVLFVVYIVYHFCTISKIREFEKEYKLSVIKPVFDKYIDKCSFQPDKGLDSAYVASLSAIQMGNIYHSEDFVTGFYKDVQFCRSDLLIQNKTRDSDGDTHTTTYFKGQWMIFEFNKSFKKDVQVFSKSFGYTVKGRGLFGLSDRRQKTEFENEAFNDRFKVYANSQEEAFYIITPPVMEAIMSLDDNIKGKIMLFFNNNKLNVAICSHKNSLEPSYKKDAQAATEAAIKGAQDELKTIIDFVEQLKLDNDLYK